MIINATGITSFSQTAYCYYSNVLSRQTQQNEEGQSQQLETTAAATKSSSRVSAKIAPQHFPELFSQSGQALTPLSVQLKAIHVSELPEERYQQFIQAQKQLIEANQQHLEHKYSSRNKPQAEHQPQTQPYAIIKVGGKVVASVDNQGVVTTASGLSQDLLTRLPNELNGGNGPDLAQARAQVLADYFGGKVEKADTAINQQEFDLLQHQAEMAVSIDYAAMHNDPMFEQLQNLMTNLKNIESQRQDFLAGAAQGSPAVV